MSADDIIQACAAGTMPPPIALMHLIGDAASEADLAKHLAQAGVEDAPYVRALCALAAANRDCWRLTHDMLATVTHDKAASVEELAAMFDEAVTRSPAASVALYSMGDEAALDTATQDVIALMRDARLIDRDCDMLDLGCGIGRFVRALAPELRHITGLDVSPKMIAEARRRCAHFANVRLAVSSGRDLALIEDDSIDLILAADVFPYLVQVDLDLAAKHLQEAARALRRGGAMLILNFSYRGDAARDAQDLHAMLAQAGLRQAELAARPLAHWDAAAFLLRKPD